MGTELHEGFPLREKPEPANCQPIADDKIWDLWKGVEKYIPETNPLLKTDNEIRSL